MTIINVIRELFKNVPSRVKMGEFFTSEVLIMKGHHEGFSQHIFKEI